MTPEIRQKLAKIYELVKRGTDGEQAAAQAALDRMMDKYGLEGIDLDSLDKAQRSFTYTTNMEHWLLLRIMKIFTGDAGTTSGYRIKCHIVLVLTYLEYVTVSCAYEYFRRHMKAQWAKLCAPELAKCRTNKTKARRRQELQDVFFDRYCIASKIYRPEELSMRPVASTKEYKNNLLVHDVEGGEYNRQVVVGLMLN